MAATFGLITTEQTIEPLTPTVTADIVEVTTQCLPSGVIARFAMTLDDFNAGKAATFQETISGRVQEVFDTGMVIGGSSVQTLDANNLATDAIEFVVAYQVPGALAGPATINVVIPCSSLVPLPGSHFVPSMIPVLDQISAAYDQLKAAAGG